MSRDRATEAILAEIETARQEVREALKSETNDDQRQHLQQLEKDLNCQVSYNRR